MKRKVAIVLATVIMFIVTIPIFAKAAELPVDEKYGAYCEEIGAKYNICPELLEAIIEQESSGNPNGTPLTGKIGTNPRNLANWNEPLAYFATPSFGYSTGM